MTSLRLLLMATLTLFAGSALAGTSIYYTNSTPETVTVEVEQLGPDYLADDDYETYAQEIEPYATEKVLSFNRYWGVSSGNWYYFATHITGENSTNTLYQAMKGTWTGSSKIWHTASGDDFSGDWHNGWDIHRYDTQYDGRASKVGMKAHSTSGYANFRYTTNNVTQTEEASGEDALKVVSYNIEDLYVSGDKRSERVNEIPNHMEGYDVVMFQEAFSGLRDGLKLDLSDEYPYQTYVPGSTNYWDLDVVDSGVFIVSKHPIVNTDDFIYTSCSGTDCYGTKGVIYAEVVKGGKAYHVANTHVASFDTEEAREDRIEQFGQIRDLIDDQNIPSWEAVMIGGDMNVNKFKFPGDHDLMLDTLNASEPTNTGHGATYDAPINSNIGSEKVQYLDYVLYANDHRQPVSARNDVRVPRAITADLWNWWDLSDHYPVMGEFRF